MNLISRYVLRHIWAPTIGASLIVTVLFLGAGLQKQIGEFQKSFPIAQLSIGDVGEIAILVLPTLLGLIVPLSFVLGIMVAFGGLSGRHEIVAMQAAGMSLRSIIFPVLCAGGLLSVAAFGLQDRVQPLSYGRLMRLLETDIPERVSLASLPPGSVHRYGDWRFYARDVDRDGALLGIVLYVQGDGEEVSVYYAESGRVDAEDGRISLALQIGTVFLYEGGKGTTRATFDSLTVETAKVFPSGGIVSRRAESLATLLWRTRELDRTWREGGRAETGTELRRYQKEVSERLSFPVMCFAMTLLAAPLAVRTPKAGRSWAFVQGGLVIGGYFFLRKLVEPLWVPSLAATIGFGQIPNVIAAGVGSVLIWRVDRT